uniref:G-protein coupled receptors family 1 profile domain-containing protein n=1 Tax=Anopheles christyi TaxID=43041 RepID=A0A182KEI2_9DIPT
MSALRYYQNLNESFTEEEPALLDGMDGFNRIQKSIRLLSGEMIAASAPWTSPAPAGSPPLKELLLDEVGVDDYVPYEQRPETYIVPVVFALIFIVGIVGNGTLVVIFLRHRAMRNIPNT